MSENKTRITTQDAPLLTWTDAIRKRPGMYFGGTDCWAVYELIWNVFHHAVDDTMDKVDPKIYVTLIDANTISISDNGPGLPIELDEGTGRSLLDFHLTGLHDKKGDAPLQAYRTSMFGVRLACVNPVCVEFIAQVKRNGFLWQQQYKEGLQQSELAQVRSLLSHEPNGTTIIFKPDFSIFDRCDFDYELLLRRCREMAYLVSGMTITLQDKRSEKEARADTFYYPDGLKQCVTQLNRDYPVLHDPIVIKVTVDLERNYKPLGYTAILEIAFQYADVHQPVLLGFVNGLDVQQGGTHIQGFVEALTRQIEDYASKIRVGGYYTFIEDDIVCGLAAVLNIWHPSPKFAGAISRELTNPELKDATYDVTSQALEAFSADHPDLMKRILDKCFGNKALRLRRRYS